MNKKIGTIGSIVNAITVVAFAICMLINFNFGSYFVCLFLALSFILMITSFENECTEDNKVSGKIAIVFAAIYAALVHIVYFTQCTSVINDRLSNDALKILNFSNMGLMFNLDILGYGFMALSTFFISFTIDAKNQKDKALKYLLLIHGFFFIACLILPMTGMFSRSGGNNPLGGVIALELWCLYFLPISILSYKHFKDNK